MTSVTSNYIIINADKSYGWNVNPAGLCWNKLNHVSQVTELKSFVSKEKSLPRKYYSVSEFS